MKNEPSKDNSDEKQKKIVTNETRMFDGSIRLANWPMQCCNPLDKNNYERERAERDALTKKQGFAPWLTAWSERPKEIEICEDKERGKGGIYERKGQRGGKINERRKSEESSWYSNRGGDCYLNRANVTNHTQQIGHLYVNERRKGRNGRVVSVAVEWTQGDVIVFARNF